MNGLLVAASVAVAVSAPNWENTEVNSENRLPARTYSMPIAGDEAALTDALEPESPWKMSLNGNWKFSWAGNPALRVQDFFRTDFDDSDWFEIDVPSCVELRGFGSAGYVNILYPHANKWPRILDRQTEKPDYNPVSSYRRVFTVPAEWKGRRVIIRFDGVYSAYYLWINGRKVGYAEDSCLPSEFDATEFVKFGAENQIAVEVYRWCDGSYLEDQDMVRYSGIFRDVTLWSMPKDGIWDFYVTAGADGRIAISGVGGEWTAALYDAEKNRVSEFSGTGEGEVAKVLEKVNLWSAEKPYLYTLVVKKGGDVRMRRVGFKTQKIIGHTVFVNGQKVKFKGVNRHETSPENGRAVTMEDMLADIRLMKRYNINTVRTSHYPNHHLWYDLCDRYGIYLCAEANVEAHEPGYGDDGLGRFKEWNHSIVERNERHVKFYRNHPSVTFWSMGNETGHGDCFRNAIAKVKATDPTRLVHWERGNEDADIDSRMYPHVEWLEKRGQMGDGMIDDDGTVSTKHNVHTRGKAFFMCEYAHAMGNAIGNFQEYWDVFYRYDSLSGGCIWDWVDQAVWKDTEKLDARTGKRGRIFAYGGDFDEEPNDGPFDCNGVVDPLRRVSAKLMEVGHVHRNLVVTRSVAEGDNPFAAVFELWNRYCFTTADEFVGSWKLRENGVVTKEGAFAPPALAPLSRCRFTVPGLAEALAASKSGAELFVDFEFSTKADAIWAEKGWVVARDQVAMGGKYDFAAKASAGAVVFEAGEKTVVATIADTRAVFCRKSGTLCELVMNGKTVMSDPAEGLTCGPRVQCMRALTDNDKYLRGRLFNSGLTQLRYHARRIVVDGSKLRVVTEVTGSRSAGFTHTAEWSFGADGSLTVKNLVEPHGTMPAPLPRLGLTMRIAGDLDRVEWYGRGPHENYIDRRTSAFFGVWSSTVEKLGEFYVRPQDNGCRSDVRWAKFTAANGVGLRVSASEPLFMQAMRCWWEDLEFCRHQKGDRRFNAPVVEDKWITLNLDVRQLGLGGASCGPQPMEKYRFAIEPIEWEMTIAPVK